MQPKWAIGDFVMSSIKSAPSGHSKPLSNQGSDSLTMPLASYAHTRRVGDLIFVAGQGCRDPKTNTYAGVTYDDQGKIKSYDIAAQARGVLQNIELALLSEGLSRQHLVDVQVFLCDMKDFAAMNQVWNEFFMDSPLPTRTTVAVSKLPGDNFVEMKAIAHWTMGS